jgi:hypothetical protein
MAKTRIEYTGAVSSLRRYLPKFPGGVEGMATELGMPSRRLRAYRDGQNPTPLHVILSVATALGAHGASFLADLCAENGVPVTVLPIADPVCPRVAHASMLGAAHHTADALADDGKIDHIEAARILPAVDAAAAMIPRLQRTLRKVRAAA